MDCCENKNNTYKIYENVCINCGTIHDYKYVMKYLLKITI